MIDEFTNILGSSKMLSLLLQAYGEECEVLKILQSVALASTMFFRWGCQTISLEFVFCELDFIEKVSSTELGNTFQTMFQIFFLICHFDPD